MMRARGDCHGANRGLGEQISETGDFAERGRRILLGWDGGRYSQRGRSRLEQAVHPPSAHAAVFTGRCAPGVTPSRLGTATTSFRRAIPWVSSNIPRCRHGRHAAPSSFARNLLINRARSRPIFPIPIAASCRYTRYKGFYFLCLFQHST